MLAGFRTPPASCSSHDNAATSAALRQPACVTGKPVYIYAPERIIPEKHKKLHQALYNRHMARPLEQADGLPWSPAMGLDEAAMVAREIRARFASLFAA